MRSGERAISRAVADSRRAPFDLQSMDWAGLKRLIEGLEGFESYGPEGVYAVDPRDGGVTLFNQGRAKRPKDYTPAAAGGVAPTGSSSCPICEGRTTPIVDIAELDSGFTFINMNLYPILAPSRRDGSPRPPGPEPTRIDALDTAGAPTGGAVGAHFLQWTSCDHHVDWPELSRADRLTAMTRLARLEAALVDLPGLPIEGHVGIIKNVGLSVGGSLSHGHQQIALSSVMPRRTRENAAFLEARGETFSCNLLRETARELVVRELDGGTLLVPFYMRRPFDMLFLLHNTVPSRLHELRQEELATLADGFALGMELLRELLPSLGREVAYNVILHTGAGGGIYLEFLPWTQENGGFEQLGLSACQGVPREAAQLLRELL